MLSSDVRAFSDPDDYTASMRGTSAETTVIGRGQFTASLTRIVLQRLWMQRFSDNLPRIARAANAAGRAFVSFRTEPGPRLFAGGLEIHPTSVLRHSHAQDFYQRSFGPASFAAMSLPIEDIASVGEFAAGADLTPPRDPTLVIPPHAAMARLRRLHAAAGRLVEEAPEIIANPDAAKGLEQAVIEAVIDCLRHGQEHETTLAQGQHAIVMRRFRRVLEENPEQSFFIPELCKAIKVSDRTLRVCCQEHLGMSPRRYLLLRRMYLARRALRMATTDAATVTEVATRYGFWQLGRFAVEYRSLFGEMPSATLRRQLD
jgi:AraC-like DNA-binding protein